MPSTAVPTAFGQLHKKEDDAMAKTMSPSDVTPISVGQIAKIQELIGAGLRKSNLPSTAIQQLIETKGDLLVDTIVEFIRRRVDEYLRATEPHILERKPFDPGKFLGSGWSVTKQIGKRSGGNLDARKIVLKDYLQSGESIIKGEERLRRIKANPADVQLDAADFLALYLEKGQKTLQWLYDTQGITWLSFWGTILRNPLGYPVILCLRLTDGWFYDIGWDGDDDWGGGPSAVLVSSSVTP
jgi:hypothetical protein